LSVTGVARMDYVIVNWALTIGAVFGQIFVIVALIASILKKDKWLIKYVGQHGLVFVFIISLVAMSGSLYYSDVALFTPCRLCWYQRIFMYPIVFLSALSIIRRSKDIIPYLAMLAGLGLPISIFHYNLQMNQHLTGSDNCAIAGGASCSESYFQHLGYITIAMLALTAFAMILTCLRYAHRYNQQHKNK